MSDDTECICDTAKSRGYSRYYDEPEGCDMFTKMIVAGRYGAIVGTVLSAYDIMMYSHATTFGRMMQRYAFHTVPLTLMGVTFAAVSTTVCQMRDEDDKFNYFLGGLACGPIVGAYLRSGHAVLLGGLVLGWAAMAKKLSLQMDAPLIPDIVPHMGLAWSWRNDWTMAKDPKLDALKECDLAGKSTYRP